MPAYNDRSDPPAPFAMATIRVAEIGKSITDVPMLLDTGSDATLIPRLVVEALGLITKKADGIRLMAFDGTVSEATTARVEIDFLNKMFRGDFLTTEGNHGIIGRDILNLLSLHFDGPNLVWGER